MKKIILSLLVLIIYSPPIAAQLTPEQEKLLKHYRQNQGPDRQIELTQKYSSPIIYNILEDSLKLDKDKPVIDNKSDYRTTAGEDTDKREKPELKLFGHDIFESSEGKFASDIFALPPADYTLGPGDHIIVNIWGRVNQEMELTVDREGKVFIPRVGDVIALGSTYNQFKSKLKKQLDKIYSDYYISVSPGKLRQIRIYVFGEVNKPGGYTISSLATLLHALYVAEGVTENGSLRDIRLIRKNGKTQNNDLYELLLKGDRGGDLKLLSGDVVYLPVCGPIVSISGEIKRPAIYELLGKENAADLIEMAGGATATAYLKSITLDRVGPNDSRVLLDINLYESPGKFSADIELQDGDKLKIHSIYDFHENEVRLSGNVKHPGSFAYVDSMRISDLINSGEQLKEMTYLTRADLFRKNNDGTISIIPIALDSVLDGNETDNILLNPFDSLVVFSHEEIMREKYASIAGAVKNPGKYKLYNRMRLSDLIFLAGNLTKQAYMLRAELARVNPGMPSDLIYLNLEDILVKKIPDSDPLLKEDDHVFIRQIPKWRPVQVVTIEGEVYFPGEYAINYEIEKLSDLIERAGGLTPTAFPKGMIYLRNNIQKEVARRNIGQIIKNTTERHRDSDGKEFSGAKAEIDFSQLNRIIMNLPEILRNPRGSVDIQLADSDYIYIPSIPSGIQVMGAVASNGTIAFSRGKNSKYYLEQAGGLTPAAAKSEVRLVKADGRVLYGRKALNKKIEIGDAIVVPAKIKGTTDWGKVINASATLIGSLATTILLIDRLAY